jgi:hypothetical protein
MIMRNRACEVRQRHATAEQAACGRLVELAAAPQLRFQPESAECLPHLIEPVEQISPALGDRAAVGIGQGGELAAAVGRQPQLHTVCEDHRRRLSRFQGVAHPGKFGFERTAALAEQITPGRREADGRRRIVNGDTARQLVGRPCPTQRCRPLIELDLVADLGQACRSSQPGQPATDHHHRTGHQRSA